MHLARLPCRRILKSWLLAADTVFQEHPEVSQNKYRACQTLVA